MEGSEEDTWGWGCSKVWCHIEQCQVTVSWVDNGRQETRGSLIYSECLLLYVMFTILQIPTPIYRAILWIGADLAILPIALTKFSTSPHLFSFVTHFK